MSNCPNCNAILSYEGGLHCDYCGARFERPGREIRVDVKSPDVSVREIAENLRRMASIGAISVNEIRELMDD